MKTEHTKDQVYLALNDGIYGDHFLIEYDSVKEARMAARDDADVLRGRMTWKILIEVASSERG